MAKAQFVAYEEKSVDGLNELLLCNGEVHAVRFDGGIDKDFHVDGPCNGSCKLERRLVDVRVEVARLRVETLEERSITLTTRVNFDEKAHALFADGQPIIGFRVSSSYAKRSGRHTTACVDREHVHVYENFDWWSGNKTGFYKTIDVNVEPCDCASRFGEVTLTKGEKRKLRMAA